MGFAFGFATIEIGTCRSGTLRGTVTDFMVCFKVFAMEPVGADFISEGLTF